MSVTSDGEVLGEGEYEVEAIRGFLTYDDAYNYRALIQFNPPCRDKHKHSKYVYNVKWRGYGEDENTWEPESQLGKNVILADFKRDIGLEPEHSTRIRFYDFDSNPKPRFDKENLKVVIRRNRQPRKPSTVVRDYSPRPCDDTPRRSGGCDNSEDPKMSRREYERRVHEQCKPVESKGRICEASISHLFEDSGTSHRTPTVQKISKNQSTDRISENGISSISSPRKKLTKSKHGRENHDSSVKLMQAKVFKQLPRVRESRVVLQLASSRRWSSTERLNDRWRKEVDIEDIYNRHVKVASKVFQMTKKLFRKYPHKKDMIVKTQLLFMRQRINYDDLRESKWKFDSNITKSTSFLKDRGIPMSDRLSTAELNELASRLRTTFVPVSELKARPPTPITPSEVVLGDGNVEESGGSMSPQEIEDTQRVNKTSAEPVDMPIEMPRSDLSTEASASRSSTSVTISSKTENLTVDEWSDDDIMVVDDPRILEDGETEVDYNMAIKAFLAEDFAVEGQADGTNSACTEKMTRAHLMERVVIRLKSLILPVTTRLRQLGYDHNDYSLPLLQKACACYFLGYLKEFSHLLEFLSTDVRWAVAKIVPLEIPLCLPELEAIRCQRYKSERNLTRTSQHNRSPKCIVDERSTLIPCGSYYNGQHFVKVDVDGSGTFAPILSLLDSDLFDDSDGAAMPRRCSKDHLKCSFLHGLVAYAPDKCSAFAFASNMPKGEIVKPVSPLSASHLFAMVGYAARCQLEKIFSDGMPMQLNPMVKMFAYKMTPEVMDFLRPLGYENFEADSGPMLMYVTFVHVLVSRCTLGDLRSFVGLGIDTNSLAFRPGQKKRPTLVLASLLKLRTIVDKEIRSRPEALKRFELNINFINAHNLRLSKWIHGQSSDRIVNAYRAVQTDNVSILGTLTPVHTVRFTDAHSEDMSYSVVTLCSPVFSDVDLGFDEIRAGVSRNAFHVVVAVVPFKFSSERGDELVPVACEHPGVDINRILVSASPLERWSKGPYLQNGLFFRIQPEIFESSGLCDRNSASRLLLEVDGPCAVGQLVLLQVFLVGNVDCARQLAELAKPALI